MNPKQGLTDIIHPGNALLFPVQRGSGSGQDFTTDGAGAVYMNREDSM